MLQHYFIDSSDGTLFDTRDSQWTKKPLRKNYARSHSHIKSVADFKATLRGGKYAWPGGYPLYLICSDGAALCYDCARKECRNVINSIQRKAGEGWRVVACDVNYEDNDLFCAHCSSQIESAYGPVDSEDGKE